LSFCGQLRAILLSLQLFTARMRAPTKLHFRAARRAAILARTPKHRSISSPRTRFQGCRGVVSREDHDGF
jgi:hypothetical protein